MMLKMKPSQLLVLSFVVWLPGKSRAWGRLNAKQRGLQASGDPLFRVWVLNNATDVKYNSNGTNIGLK